MSTVVVSVGDNCIDHYLSPIGLDYSGGNAVNVAVHIQRAGCPSAYIGAIGSDENGQKLLHDLGTEGVDTTHVKVYSDRSTACTHIRLNEVKEREFVYEDLGPQDVFKLDEADFTFIQQHRLVHNTWQGGTDNYLAQFKQATGLLISQDYGERCSAEFIQRTISYVDVAFFSLPEDSEIEIKEYAKGMKDLGPGLVVVTQGLLGSVAYDGKFYFQQAYPIEVVDTLGAGDAYIGTFLANWLDHKKIEYCMKTAAQVASQTCSHFGGW